VVVPSWVAMRMSPLDSTTMSSGSPAPDTVVVPAVPKDVSTDPPAVSSVSVASPPGVSPPTRISPSGRTATAFTESTSEISSTPPLPNSVSGEPSALSRAT
jgi:hypothetical protein